MAKVAYKQLAHTNKNMPTPGNKNILVQTEH